MLDNLLALVEDPIFEISGSKVHYKYGSMGIGTRSLKYWISAPSGSCRGLGGHECGGCCRRISGIHSWDLGNSLPRFAEGRMDQE